MEKQDNFSKNPRLPNLQQGHRRGKGSIANMKWSSAQTAEKKFPKTMSYTATCVELPSAKNAEPPDYVPRAPNSGNQK